MTENKNDLSDKRLSVKESIRTIFVQEMKSVIYDHKGSAYIKFINIAIGIEYLGALLEAGK